MPEAKSKYIVSVKAKKAEWRNLYSFSSITCYPSYYLNKTTGAEYIDAYQFEMMPGSGPYLLNNQRTTQENNGLVVLDESEITGQQIIIEILDCITLMFWSLFLLMMKIKKLNVFLRVIMIHTWFLELNGGQRSL